MSSLRCSFNSGSGGVHSGFNSFGGGLNGLGRRFNSVGRGLRAALSMVSSVLLLHATNRAAMVASGANFLVIVVVVLLG